MRELRGGPRLPLGSRALSWLLTLGLVLAGLVGGVGLAPSVRAETSVPVGCGPDGVGVPGALIAAIEQVQGDPDGGTVVLASDCIYTLTEVNNTSSNGANGLPRITTTLHIVGHGATIARGDAAATPAFRFFELEDAPDVSLTLEGVTLTNGLVGTGLHGGAIVSRGGAVTLVDSELRGNTAAGGGGAIYTYSGAVAVTRSMLSGNTSGVWGGAINTVSGAVTVSGSTLSGNSTGSLGGAIDTLSGAVTVSGSMLSDNRAGSRGGAIRTFSGAVTVAESTLSDNTADGDGGAIRTISGAVTVTESTLSGNTAAADGGAIRADEGAVTVSGSTLSGNTAGEWGGAIVTIAGDVRLAHSILAHAAGASGALCAVGGSVDDGGYTLATDASCGLTGAGSLNDATLEALALGALADNGGPTPTIALGPRSVAIDRIPAGACSSATDQRGVTRPQGQGCDVGAFEVVPLDATVTLDPGTGTPVVVDRTTRRATLTLGSTATVDEGDAQWALPVSYTLTPLGGGAPLSCTDEHGSGGDATTLQSTCSLPGVPAGRYTVTASVGGYYTGAAEPITVVVVDPLAGFVTGGGMVQGGMLSFSASYYGTQLNGAMSYQRTSGGRVALSTTKLTSFVRVGATVYVEGEASLNGVSGHRVLLTAIDHPGLQRDQVQLQVWDRDGALVASASFDLTFLQTGQVYIGPGL